MSADSVSLALTFFLTIDAKNTTFIFYVGALISIMHYMFQPLFKLHVVNFIRKGQRYEAIVDPSYPRMLQCIRSCVPLCDVELSHPGEQILRKSLSNVNQKKPYTERWDGKEREIIFLSFYL